MRRSAALFRCADTFSSWATHNLAQSSKRFRSRHDVAGHEVATFQLTTPESVALSPLRTGLTSDAASPQIGDVSGRCARCASDAQLLRRVRVPACTATVHSCGAVPQHRCRAPVLSASAAAPAAHVESHGSLRRLCCGTCESAGLRTAMSQVDGTFVHARHVAHSHRKQHCACTARCSAHSTIRSCVLRSHARPGVTNNSRKLRELSREQRKRNRSWRRAHAVHARQSQGRVHFTTQIATDSGSDVRVRVES